MGGGWYKGGVGGVMGTDARHFHTRRGGWGGQGLIQGRGWVGTDTREGWVKWVGAGTKEGWVG